MGYYAERVREQNERREELLQQIAEKNAAKEAARRTEQENEKHAFERLQKATEARLAENQVHLRQSRDSARAAIQAVLDYAEQKQARLHQLFQ